MKATLTYEFNLPEEDQELQQTVEMRQLAAHLEDFQRWLRSELKYNLKLSGEQREAYELIQSKYFEAMGDLAL